MFRWEETLCIIMSGKLRKCSLGYKGVCIYMGLEISLRIWSEKPSIGALHLYSKRSRTFTLFIMG
jgi:hypothetical protein